MRWLVLLAPMLSGCLLGAIQDSGRECPAGDPVEDGFRVTVPEVVGEERSLVRTHGYCVTMHPGVGGDPETVRSVREGVAWFPVEAAGTHRFSLSVRDPADPYCAFWMEAEVQHDGTGVVEVSLPYDGTSVCN